MNSGMALKDVDRDVFSLHGEEKEREGLRGVDRGRVEDGLFRLNWC